MSLKLTQSQSRELVEKLATEIVDGIEEKNAGEGEQQMTEEQIKALIAAKKQEVAEREAEGETDGAPATQKEAPVTQEEKAAAVYYNALSKIAACEDMYYDGAIQQQACIETLAEAGLYDEHGLNKEAAEASEETVYFTNKVADLYQDGEEKIAAAQECYAEAHQELSAAMEVLAEYGYTFE